MKIPLYNIIPLNAAVQALEWTASMAGVLFGVLMFVRIPRRHMPRLRFVGYGEPHERCYATPTGNCWLQSLVIKNTQTSVPITALRVVARISYEHIDGVNKFIVRKADWWDTSPGSLGGGPSVNLLAGEAENLIVSRKSVVDGKILSSPEVGEQFQELVDGQWTLSIKITADNANTLYLKGGLHVARKHGHISVSFSPNCTVKRRWLTWILEG